LKKSYNLSRDLFKNGMNTMFEWENNCMHFDAKTRNSDVDFFEKGQPEGFDDFIRNTAQTA